MTDTDKPHAVAEPAGGPPGVTVSAPAVPPKPVAAGSPAAVATKPAGQVSAATPAAVTPKPRPKLLAIMRRLPFTSAYVVITLVLSIVLGTLWEGIENKSWFGVVGYGLPALEDGRWYTLITGNFFALIPVYYVFVVGFFAVLTGFAEWRLGTARTVVITVFYQLLSVLLVALLFLIFRNSGWDWAAQRSTETDVGFSAGMMAAVSVASATVRPPWRLRLRLAIWVYVIFSILFIGQMADAEHLCAVLFSMPISSRLAGDRALKAPALPTRREIRLLAMVGTLVSAATQLIDTLLPNRLTPFGNTDEEPTTWYFLLLNLALAVLIANGLRHGYRWAWWVAVVQNGVPLAITLLVVVLLIVSAFVPDLDAELEGLPQILSNGILTLAFFILLIAGRRSFRVPRRSKRRLGLSTSHPETARELLEKSGGSTISWMTTWPENRHMITEDGNSYVAFRKHAGVAVALGDPIGPPDETQVAVNDFVNLCNSSALVPYIFSCTERTTVITDQLGWQSVQVAEDNIIDLPGLEFKGKKWQDIRTAVNKAAKEGITFTMVALADQPWSLVRQVENLSEEWLGDKKLPEMGFTLGGVSEALDPQVKVGLAVDAAGVVHGVTSWMPVYGSGGRIDGWTLDLMRRKDGGFRSTMEFLIAASCMHFKAEGAQFVSLSGAPLAKSDSDEAGETVVERFLDTLGESLEPVYGFRSLHAFKSKFQPRLSPMYMVFRDEADLPRIGIAITKAYLPDSRVRDLLAMMRH